MARGTYTCVHTISRKNISTIVFVYNDWSLCTYTLLDKYTCTTQGCTTPDATASVLYKWSCFTELCEHSAMFNIIINESLQIDTEYLHVLKYVFKNKTPPHSPWHYISLVWNKHYLQGQKLSIASATNKDCNIVDELIPVSRWSPPSITAAISLILEAINHLKAPRALPMLCCNQLNIAHQQSTQNSTCSKVKVFHPHLLNCQCQNCIQTVAFENPWVAISS